MTIEERVHGGKIFRQCWELIEEQAEKLSPAAADNFWTAFRDAMREKFPPADQPMTNAEYDRFHESEIPFGRYRGNKVGTGGETLDYLVWIANQTFIDELRRFLKHGTSLRRIEQRNQEKFREHYDGESSNEVREDDSGD